MDVNQGGQRNNDAEDYHTRTSHVHNHGSMHEYNAVREQGNETPIHEHNMMGKEHKMVHTEHMQMRKTFTLETDTDFLIEGIKISSIQGILLAVIFTFAVTVLLDILKFMMLMQEIHKGNYIKTRVQKKRQTWRLFVTAISHMLSVSLAYSMMLCIMTMNIWLMVSVVLGSGFAHFVMRPVLSRRLERQSEHSKDLNIERTDGEAELLDQNDDQGIQQRRRRSTKTLSIRRSLLIEDSTYV